MTSTTTRGEFDTEEVFVGPYLYYIHHRVDLTHWEHPCSSCGKPVAGSNLPYVVCSNGAKWKHGHHYLCMDCFEAFCILCKLEK